MTLSLVASATAAGLSAALLAGPGPQRVLSRRLPPERVPWGPRGATRWRVHHGRRAVVLVAVVIGVFAFAGPSALLLAVAAVLALGGAQWVIATGRRRGRAARARRQTVEVCDALAAEMRAGQPATQALTRAAELYPTLLPAARAGAFGGDVPAALRGVASSPGEPPAVTGACTGMRAIAAAWQVAEDAGSGLADALERMAEALRADDATQQELTATLSPARATARLLAVLPVFGLLVGAGLGGDPVGLLLGTPLGHALLLAGVVLALAGTVWVERLTMSVEAAESAESS